LEFGRDSSLESARSSSFFKTLPELLHSLNNNEFIRYIETNEKSIKPQNNE